MKIGILTYHAVYNFGANLQALSTFCYLKNNGHDPVIIDFFPEKLEESFDKNVPLVQANAHKSFLMKHFVMTNRCRDAEGVAREIVLNNIEAVIIGSDAVVQHFTLLDRISIFPSRRTLLKFQVAQVNYETNFPNPFWGEFIDYLDRNIKIVMMSVSCQNTDYKLIRGRTRKSIHEKMQKLSYISVRDDRTQMLIRHVSNNSIIPNVTPDPVFAFNDNFKCFTSKIETIRKFNLPENYILLSFNSAKTVSKLWLGSFKKISAQSGYKCVALAMPGGIRFEHEFDYKIDIPLDPIDWYSLIRYSSAYIGEKMHPVIVSIHNSVPFFSFDHYGVKRLNLFLNQKASKIHQILENARLSDYRSSTRNKTLKSIPKPEYVFRKIQSFDRGKCSKFAVSMSREYKEMMEDILSVLSNK